MNDRDLLRELCAERQDGLCVRCGRGLYGGGHLHEAIVKKGDLPNDDRIFVPENCCVLHDHCHENTKEVDDLCIAWLLRKYGGGVLLFIESLGMKSVPGRVKDVLEKRKRISRND